MLVCVVYVIALFCSKLYKCTNGEYQYNQCTDNERFLGDGSGLKNRNTAFGTVLHCHTSWTDYIMRLVYRHNNNHHHLSAVHIDDIMCLVDRRGWQRHQRTLGNAYTHNDRSSSRLSGLSSLVLLSCTFQLLSPRFQKRGNIYT